MATLIEALRQLGIAAEAELSGRWVAIRGERATAYVVEAGWGTSFYVWCDIPADRSVERYRDPIEAVQAGVRRAGGGPMNGADSR